MVDVLPVGSDLVSSGGKQARHRTAVAGAGGKSAYKVRLDQAMGFVGCVSITPGPYRIGHTT